MSAPTAPQLFWLALFLLGSVACFRLLRLEKARARNGRALRSDPDTADFVLNLARDQRAAFRIRPAERSIASTAAEDRTFDRVLAAEWADDGASTAGTAVRLDRQRLVLRLSGPPADRRLCPGAEVDVDFCVIRAGSEQVFRFPSVILRDYGGGLLELARPARLELWRRRFFDRVAPPRPEVLDLGVWAWDPATPCPLRPEGPPDLAFVPGRLETVRLADISAAGAALRVRRDTLSALGAEGRLKGCLLLVRLRDAGGRPLTLWLACARRHATTRTSRPRSLTLGLSFVRWAEVADADSPISWKHAASGGEVPPLLAWTLRRIGRGVEYRPFNL